MAIDYVAWIRESLERNPHLSRAGLARHLNRDRAVISLMLQGKREIKARELSAIEGYLGVPRPDRQGVAAPTVEVIGRCSAAWYEEGTAPEVRMQVSPVLSRSNVRQVGFILDVPMLGYPAGAVVIAVPVERGKPIEGNVVVVTRERSGLVNTTLARAGEVEGTVVAVAIEVRVPV